MVHPMAGFLGFFDPTLSQSPFDDDHSLSKLLELTMARKEKLTKGNKKGDRKTNLGNRKIEGKDD